MDLMSKEGFIDAAREVLEYPEEERGGIAGETSYHRECFELLLFYLRIESNCDMRGD